MLLERLRLFQNPLLPSVFRLPPASPGTGRGEQFQCPSGLAVKCVPPRVMVLHNTQPKCKTPRCSSFWQDQTLSLLVMPLFSAEINAFPLPLVEQSVPVPQSFGAT